jgi:hypothetical protein
LNFAPVENAGLFENGKRIHPYAGTEDDERSYKKRRNNGMNIKMNFEENNGAKVKN